MSRATANPKASAMTFDQVEARKARGVEGLRNMGEEDRADTLEDESVEGFAERKNITIVNPRGRQRRKNLFGFGGGKKTITREEAQELQKDAARSHCNKGEYSLAKKTARMSPARFARQRNMKIEGVVGRTIRKGKKALGSKLSDAGNRLQQNPRRRRNPDTAEEAAAMFKRFHGRKATTVQEIEIRQQQTQNLAGCGRLLFLRTDLTRKYLGGGMGISWRDEDGVIVACDPEGNQIFFVGGSQNVLPIMEAAGWDTYGKDLVDLGECDHIIYVTDKAFDHFEEKDYQHEFGEEDRKKNLKIIRRPRLMFDVPNEQLYLIGGAYYINYRGIVN